MSALAAITWLALALAPAAWAENPPVSIRTSVQMVTVSPPRAMQIIPRLLDAATTEQTVLEIQKMIASGEATLTAWPMVVSPNGARAVTETIEEFRYTSDFDSSRSRYFGAIPPFPLRRPLSDSFRGEITGAFETRSIGPVLEVSARSIGSQTIEANLVACVVRFVGMKPYVQGRFETGPASHLPQPQFKNHKVEKSLTLRSGSHVLIGTFQNQTPEPTVELFILHAVILPTTP